MGYKRSARILFLSGEHAAPANLAAHYANRLGAEWMIARAAVLPDVGGEAAVLDVDSLEWADVLVTLDAVALAARPALRPGLQHRHYPFEPAPDSSDKIGWSDFALRVRNRIEGMIGGLRLLENASHAADDL